MTETRRELLSLIESWGAKLPHDFDDDTPLISSGAIDSLALFELLSWIEEKTGRAVDPTTVDLPASWDSVRLILSYLHGRDAMGPSHGVAHQDARPVRSAPGIRIVRYSPRHRTAVAEFQKALWGPDTELNRAYLEWKYEQNPYGSEPHIYLALDRSEIVGMRGFCASRWEAGSPVREVNILVAEDFLLRSDHRNEGLATRIMREAFADLRGKGCSYVFNLTGGPLTVLGSLAMGWRSAGHLDRARRETAARKARMTFRRWLLRRPLVWRYADPALFTTTAERAPFTRIDQRRGVHRSATGVAVQIDAKPRPREMAQLVARLGHDGRIRHLRDEAYFNWRFRDPRHEYRFLFAGDDVLRGYLVVAHTAVFAAVRPRVNIADVEADEPRIRSALLDAAIHAGGFSQLVIGTATLDPGFISHLMRYGFEPEGQPLAVHEGRHLLVRPVDDAELQEDWLLNGVRLLDLKNWDMRMIYSMGD